MKLTTTVTLTDLSAALANLAASTRISPAAPAAFKPKPAANRKTLLKTGKRRKRP